MERPGYVACTYQTVSIPTTSSRERYVTFPAVSGPIPDGWRARRDRGNGLAEMISDTIYLLRKEGEEYVPMTNNPEVDGLSGEGLLKVIQTDTREDEIMIHVNCGFTCMPCTFVIKSENFLTKPRIREEVH